MDSLRDKMAKINLVKASHVYYQYKDLEKAHRFFLDFGLLEVERREDRIYYRGYGVDPFVLCAEQANEDAFGGAAFTVNSPQDLDLVAGLSVASSIRKLDAPGGGDIVTLKDPVDQSPFHFICGQTPVPYDSQKEHRGTHPFNYMSLLEDAGTEAENDQ